MKKYRYKIFINPNLDFELVPINQVTDLDYYAFLKKEKEKDLTQFLFTSKLTINLLVQFMKEEFLRITQIELYDKDENMSEKIFEILNNYKNKNISENQLHNELDYLEDNYSIDIKKVKVISDVGNHGSLTFYVNGIFENMDPDYWNKLLISNLETAWK